MIIGMSGYAQAGKDSVGRVLTEQHGYTRLAFADVLRDVLYALNPDAQVTGDGAFVAGQYQFVPGEHYTVAELVDKMGWEWAKANTQVRPLLQRLGTDAGRRILGEDVWVNAIEVKLERLWGFPPASQLGQPLVDVVMTDCRFPNEAKAIDRWGGKVWRVNRTGVGPAEDADGNIHESEVALDGWSCDGIIWNDGDLLTLQRKTEVQLGFIL